MSLSRIHGDDDAFGARLDFAVNVTETQPPAWLVQRLQTAVTELAAYPHSSDLAAATATIAQYHGVGEDHVLVLSGVSEGFAMLPQLKPENAVIIHPGFSEPDIVLTDAHIPVHRCILAPPFELSPENIPDNADLVVIGNPTNPTGVVHSKELLAQLCAPGRTVVIDEAFLDIVGEQYSMIDQLDAVEGELIIFRSLTKTWSIAGLRVGYGIARPETLARLNTYRRHWPMGTLQLQAIDAVFDTGITELPTRRAEVIAQRTEMMAMLAQRGFQCMSNSQAPYILVRPPSMQPEELRMALKAQGIAVRRCDTFPGLDFSYWRLAVRPQDQVQRLVAAIDTIIGEQ
ncbi:Rv2231c family pyridoxal phosphate-dependent protein CobC [Corynebacterium rouxii]|uniref:Rv2231c family pyridoxal phosphate-dependent protein CobC n=1 Tax=Corynebacterium rouxii TaxID=2719119 RepID=UPI00313E01C0